MKTLLFKRIFGIPQWTIYNNGTGGDGSGSGGDGSGNNSGGGSGGSGSGSGSGNGNPNDDTPTISQNKLNAIMAEEKRKHQKAVEAHVKQLEELKKAKGLTEQERNSLQSKIEEMQNSLLSTEEVARKEKERLLNAHKTELEGITKERDTWKTRFTTSVIQRSILDAAISAEAFSPNQITYLLDRNTTLVEDQDQDGKPMGTFTPKVHIQDKTKEGKPVTLELTVEEAIKRLKESPEHANLFKANLKGGLGDTGSDYGTGKNGGPPPKDHASYLKWREKNLK